nr:unconventional myosin-Vc-like [Salvelinus alpinus]
MKKQSEQARAKMSVITRQLLCGMVEEEVISRLTSDSPDQIYEVGDLLTAFDGLQKATRVLEDTSRNRRRVMTARWRG